jgi:hypothetical protein
MGPKRKINRRVNGAFQIQALRFHEASRDVSDGDPPDWGPVLDDVERARAEFIAEHPTPTDFVRALEQRRDTIAPNRDITRTVTALIAAGRGDDAARVAEEAIARGESGSMSSTVDVLKYLAAYAKGPRSYAEFTASLIPTHDYQVIYESRPSGPTGLCREHHRGSMSRVLTEMNGRDPWALVLSARQPAGAADDATWSLYLQAAGAAKAMVVEFCRPEGDGSVRAVLGHSSAAAGEREGAIVLPRGAQMVSLREVFTAEEAVALFETFLSRRHHPRWLYTAACRAIHRRRRHRRRRQLT